MDDDTSSQQVTHLSCPNLVLEAQKLPGSYWSPVHNGSWEELALLSVEASAAISKKGREPERRLAVGGGERRKNILLHTSFL